MNRTTRSSPRRTCLALAVLAAFCAGSATAAPSANPFVVAHTARLQSDDGVMGSVAASQPIHIEVVLKLRDRAGLDQFIADNAKRPVQHPMSRDEFMATHAPTQAQAQAVADYLQGMGYRNIVIAPNRLLVSADGTAATASRAFMTNIEQVRTHDGRVAYMNTSDVLIPAALQENVLGVLGLQTVSQAHAFAQRGPQGVHTNAIGIHNPLDFPGVYHADKVRTAAGVSVGIFVNGNLTGAMADLATFATNNSLSPIATSVVKTDGGGGSDTSGQVQWDIDSQDIVGMAGGQVGQLIFYTIPNLWDSSVTANFNAIVDANAAQIVNVSIGRCEADAVASGLAASVDEILATGVAQGQNFSVAAGDSDTNPCGVGDTVPSWPATSQYVVAVGGTTGGGGGQDLTWADSGYGVSLFDPQPIWQLGSHRQDLFRGVPDLGYDADPSTGVNIVINGALQAEGGTALSAAIFSGMWARVIAAKGTGIGFAPPMIYRLPLNNDGSVSKITSGESGVGYIALNNAMKDFGVLKTGGTPPVPGFTFVTNPGALYGMTFTNTSTGTLGATVYDYGDGTAGPAYNGEPHHIYPGVGTYTVTLTDLDENLLNPVSSSQSLTIKTGGPVLNGGFETGIPPWIFSSPSLLSNIEPHGGQWDARLDGKGTKHTDVIKQTLNTTSWVGVGGELTFWLHIETAETTKTAANDTLAVSVTNTNGKVLGTLATYSNLDANTGYVEETLSLTPYTAPTATKIIVRFVGTENSSKQTTFYIDDVRAHE